MHPDDAAAGGNTLKLGWQLLGHFGHIEPKLSTPNTMDSLPALSPEQIAEAKKRSPAGFSNLRETVVNNWGKFGAAISRWENVIRRSAPAPTTPDGKQNKHQLNPVFVEWLMGLPEGHVTAVDIKRDNMLRALGNGVVPQQAALALTIMLEGKQIV